MKTYIAIALAAPLAFASIASAADHEVNMLNRDANGAVMVFEPLIVRANPGDTITFIPADKSHQSASMKDGIPEGADSWNSKINEEITITVNEEGVYMYQCTPHLGMGMIGAIVVGEPVNLDSVRKLRYPGKAKSIAERIFSEIGGI